MMELNKEVRQGLQALSSAPASGAESSSDESDRISRLSDNETDSRVVDLGSVEFEAFEDRPNVKLHSSRGQNVNAAELVFVNSAIKTNGDDIFAVGFTGG